MSTHHNTSTISFCAIPPKTKRKKFDIFEVRQRNCMKVNDIKKLIFNITKLSKWHLKTKNIVHHSAWISKGAYNELDHHIWLRETPQLRLTPHLHSNLKTLSILVISHICCSIHTHSCIKCKSLTHTWYTNVFVIWWDSQIRTETQHGKKCGLVTVSSRNVFVRFF